MSPSNLTELETIYRCKWPVREAASVQIYPSPRSLGVQMVDVVRHRVVLEHRRVFLLEVWPDGLNQHWTWEVKAREHLPRGECNWCERENWPRGPASLSPARGLKGLMTAPMALIHTGMELWCGLSGRAGNPHGSTSSRCFTLHTHDVKAIEHDTHVHTCAHTHLCGYLSV